MHHNWGVGTKTSCGQLDVSPDYITSYEPAVDCYWCSVFLEQYHEHFPKEGRR